LAKGLRVSQKNAAGKLIADRKISVLMPGEAEARAVPITQGEDRTLAISGCHNTQVADAGTRPVPA
jgi:hypothetical protein